MYLRGDLDMKNVLMINPYSGLVFNVSAFNDDQDLPDDTDDVWYRLTPPHEGDEVIPWIGWTYDVVKGAYTAPPSEPYVDPFAT